jgi:multidrug resistance efflux pump
LGFNVYNLFAVCKLCAMIAALAVSHLSAFAVTTETTVANYLIASEREMIKDASKLDKKRALQLKDLELKRGNYARAVQLVSEKIMARKDMEQARIEYEKVLIEIATNGSSAASVLAAINRQRSQLHALTSETGIAATGVGAF